MMMGDPLLSTMGHIQITAFDGNPTVSFTRWAEKFKDVLSLYTTRLSEEIIKKRLLEEFLDRILPEIQYEVKARSPSEYSKAYELAQHFELLQAARKSNHGDVGVMLAEKLGATTVSKAEAEADHSSTTICCRCAQPLPSTPFSY